MIRAVIDTNIVVSAFFWGGLPRNILLVARNKQCQIITSETLISELKDVISRGKFTKRLEQIGETVDSLVDNGYRVLVEIVEPAKIPPVITDDSDDDALIACALGGAADYIISGDHHLLTLEQYRNVKMCTVRQFLEEVLQHS